MDLSQIPESVFLLPTLIVLFVLGASWGSFLNVCIYRIPYEKSVVWPGSRCGGGSRTRPSVTPVC